MIKLIGYEFRKAWHSKIILLGIAGTLELVFLVGLLLREEVMIALTALALAQCAMAGMVMIGIVSMVLLHRDMNTRQGYMLFMTPNSSWRILGAKVIENGLSELVAGGFFAALGALDITLLFARYGQLEELWEFIREYMEILAPEIPLEAGTLLLVLLLFLCSWFATVNSAYLADVLASSILRGKGVGGFVAFLFFITLNVLVNVLIGLIPRDGMAINTLLLLNIGCSLAVAALMYVITALVMDKKLSV